MVKALRQRLLPEIRKLGFKGSFPHLRRLGHLRYDMLSIYFMPYGGAFVIEVSKCTLDEFEAKRKKYPMLTLENMDVGYFQNRQRLNPNDPNGKFDYHFKFAPSFLDVPPSKRQVEPYQYYCSVADSVVPLLTTQAQPWWEAL